MKDFDIYWQDAVAMLAGIWLMLVLGLEISSLTVTEGWITYCGGALAAMLVASGFTSKNATFAWAAAATGVIVALTPVVLGAATNPLVLASMVAGGAVIAVLSAWSAVIKKKAAAQA